MSLVLLLLRVGFEGVVDFTFAFAFFFGILGVLFFSRWSFSLSISNRLRSMLARLAVSYGVSPFILLEKYINILLVPLPGIEIQIDLRSFSLIIPNSVEKSSWSY